MPRRSRPPVEPAEPTAVRVRLSLSQLMALRSVLAEHLQCPARSEVFIDCTRGAVETTPEELLACLMTNVEW